MRAAVGYKSAISTCMGINVVGILTVGEVSPLSQQPVNRVIIVVQLHRFIHSPNSVRKARKIQIHIPNCNVFTRKEEL